MVMTTVVLERAARERRSLCLIQRFLFMAAAAGSHRLESPARRVISL